MYPTGQRTPRSYYHQGNYQQNFQWRPYAYRPDIHYQKRENTFDHSLTSNSEYERHWCETCDRGFPTINSLEKHKQQHERCNIDGCQFVAHPKVITKHIQMQHSSGLYKRIAKLVNPEEINKWIEERKKKYPTKLNIEKKSAQLKEKIKRGEKMGLQSKEHHKFNSSGNPSKRKHTFSNAHHKKSNKRYNYDKPKNQHNFNAFLKQPESRKVHADVLPDCNKKLKPFAGIQHMHMENDTDDNVEQIDNDILLIDDDFEDNCEVSVVQNPQELTVCSALSALMCSYDSSEEETEVISEKINYKLNCKNTTASSKEIENVYKVHEMPTMVNLMDQISNQDNKSDNTEDVNESNKKYVTKDEVAKSEQKLHELSTMVKSITKATEDENDNDSGPDELKIVKDTSLDTNTHHHANHYKDMHGTMKKKTTNNHFSKQIFNRSKPKLPSTLLQKLLHREMQHERNIILQCIRHIVQSNYFSK